MNLVSGGSGLRGSSMVGAFPGVSSLHRSGPSSGKPLPDSGRSLVRRDRISNRVGDKEGI